MTKLDNAKDQMLRRYERRSSWLYSRLRPPVPLVHNPAECGLPPSTGPKLFIGGAGQPVPQGFHCVDIVYFPGVRAMGDIQRLPFRAASVAAIECDAVLEHVANPVAAVAEILRVLKPGGAVHVAVPFNHPFHGYPHDYHRWTSDGLRVLFRDFEILSVGVRTGPTAMLLTNLLEYLKFIAPRPLKRPTYAFFGWWLWPLRYCDHILNRRPDAHHLANTLYLLARKSDQGGHETPAVTC